MRLDRFQNPAEFYDRTQDFLLAQSAKHNLLLGMLYGLMHFPHRYQQQPYLALVEDQGEILAIALQTPPFNLVLSQAVNLTALELLAKELHNAQHSLPGVTGLTDEAKTFAEV